MDSTLLYIIKVNGALALLFAAYYGLMRRDTWFVARRLTLWMIIGVATVYPWITFQNWMSGEEPIPMRIARYTEWLPEVVVGEPLVGEGGAQAIILPILYIVWSAGCAILLFRLAGRIWALSRLAGQCEKRVIHGVPVRLLPTPAPPFSFGKWIFLYPARHSEEEIQSILAHEQAHVVQRHTADVVLAELLTAVWWFNPVAWWIQQTIRENLEYLADDAVLGRGINRRCYQFQLLGLAQEDGNGAVARIYQSFSVLSLKKRIFMMNKRKSGKATLMKSLLLIPLVAALLFLNNACEYMRQNTGTLHGAIYKGYDSIPSVIEHMPEFPGGIEGILRYIAEHVTYPDEAIRRGVEGIVICECVIDERGSVGQVRVVRSVDPSLDWEASRVIAQMPRWTPGRHHGKEVACRYTLPVRFDLNSTQAGKPDGKGVYTNADQMPEYPGGTSALMLFLAKTLRYPSLPEADRKIGRVVCKFVVQADGRVDNIQVVRSLGEAFDQEAVRALSKMARWKPGRNDDKPVPCYFTVPITFRY